MGNMPKHYTWQLVRDELLSAGFSRPLEVKVRANRDHPLGFAIVTFASDTDASYVHFLSHEWGSAGKYALTRLSDHIDVLTRLLPPLVHEC